MCGGDLIRFQIRKSLIKVLFKKESEDEKIFKDYI